MPKPAKNVEPGLDLASAGEPGDPLAKPAEPEKPADNPPQSVAPVLDLGGLTVALDAFAGRLAALEARIPQRDPPPSPAPESTGQRILRWLREPV